MEGEGEGERERERREIGERCLRSQVCRDILDSVKMNERERERAGRESKLVGCSLVLASHFQVSVGREGWNRRLAAKK